MNIIRTALLVSAALLVAACGEKSAVTSVAPQTEPAPTTLRDRLTHESRSAEDQARDAGRKPADVIEFLGIEPGMSVLDMMAASGWYTEVLSIAVGPTGHVTAHNTPGALQMREGANELAISARLAGNRLPNVSRLNKETTELAPADGPFDAGLTALNLHDIYNRGGDAAAVAALTAVFSALKPGAVFGVIDHEGSAENDNVALHRMLKADAIRVAAAAGFVLEAESDLLHFDVDDMTQHIRADGLRGYTDRFVLRLRKPRL
jgi:predicted methyltransferase